MPNTAVIIADMLNSYDHEDAEPLVESVKEQLPGIVDLRDRAQASEALLVFVNDNHNAWEAGREELIEKALAGEHPELVEPIAPRDPMPFIAKGRHSAFYQTALEHLLRSEGVQQVVLAGQVTEQCVLYTALDAYLRGFDMVVPPDAVAHIDAELARAALKMMESNMHAELIAVADLKLDG
ncbi:MAG TPA: isochorismatase family cysteine hydrolase [Thermoleophilaceae bacterium]